MNGKTDGTANVAQSNRNQTTYSVSLKLVNNGSTPLSQWKSIADRYRANASESVKFTLDLSSNTIVITGKITDAVLTGTGGEALSFLVCTFDVGVESITYS